jgi:lipopolysaccharide export system permease protein
LHLLLAVVIGFIFVFVSRMTAVSAMNLGFAASLAVWVPNVLFLGVGLWLYTRAQK